MRFAIVLGLSFIAEAIDTNIFINMVESSKSFLIFILFVIIIMDIAEFLKSMLK